MKSNESKRSQRHRAQRDTSGNLVYSPGIFGGTGDVSGDITGKQAPKSEAEGLCYETFVNEGWTVTKRGWPDFFCYKDGEIMLVEVNPKKHSTLKRNQAVIMGLLSKRGIPCFLWTPEGGLERMNGSSTKDVGHFRNRNESEEDPHMKLATALTERSDLQRRIAEITRRLSNNAKVQEGDTPAEDPRALLTELDTCLVRLEDLVKRINLTNSTPLPDGETMTALLARRDCLQQKLRIMRGFLDEASSKIDRYSKAEIRILSTVPVAEIQCDVDELSMELRLINERIQEINWTTELM